MTASSSSRNMLFVEPKYVAAAALAWSVVSANKRDGRKLPEAHSDDDDTEILDCIPEIEEESLPEKKQKELSFDLFQHSKNDGATTWYLR